MFGLQSRTVQSRNLFGVALALTSSRGLQAHPDQLLRLMHRAVRPVREAAVFQVCAADQDQEEDTEAQVERGVPAVRAHVDLPPGGAHQGPRPR